ncbi:carboxypeptidase M32 [Ktedonobacteria bacterium brp13]|nr:carboxypeptidase M32 [Ktedonobacteria bacterium brp13]
MSNLKTSTTLEFTHSHPHINALLALIQPLEDLASLLALGGWDQQTAMPRNAGETRAQQFATLQGIYHERLTSPKIGELLAELEPIMHEETFQDADRGLVRQVRRTYDQATKLPPELVVEATLVSSLSLEAWLKARDKQDFSIFAPFLERTVAIQREIADHLGYTETRYDALLDQFEPGLTSRQVEEWFAPVRTASTVLLKRINEHGSTIDTACVHGDFSLKAQEQLCESVLKVMGYDLQSGQITRSVHPFTTSLGSPSDVRLTVRYDDHYLPMSLMAAMHEGGHALYEQGVAPGIARTLLAHGTSLGIHESQSRLWENVVGRSAAFWQGQYHLLRASFPEIAEQYSVETFARALNHVQPSLIRVEADEVTYNLHILIRFELEKDLINGNLTVADLPAAWNAKYQEYLGLTPANDVDGVLQDVHWTSNIGYFPTYTLGNLYAAQISYTLRTVFPDFDQRLANGETSFLREWLRENIHQYGASLLPDEVIKQATGESLNPQYFVRYLTEKIERAYDLPQE